MKRMKKMLSIALAVVMAFAMAMTMKVTTFAAESQCTITAPNNTHTYQIYQIFTGNVSEGTLSNIKWGANGTGKAGQTVTADILDQIKAMNGKEDQEKANKLKDYVDLNGSPVATVSNGHSVNVDEGYYLIKDADKSLTGKDDSYTTYIVKVVGNLTIKPKSDKPSSEKKVQDINDTTGETTGWQDSADYDIGDEVPFQLTGTVAKNYADYKIYKFVFHDKESDGLTFNKESVKVYVDGEKVTGGYKVVTSTEDGHTFDVVFDNLKDISGVAGGSKITVEYTSTLNDKAVLGEKGNPNKMYLEYSNNPNDTQGGETGKTPEDIVIVFTYKVVINKVDPEQHALKGAEFKLEKLSKENTWKEISVKEITNEGTTFTFYGLDDGTYRLTETKTPDKYNTIEPITFKVVASHDEKADDPKLISLSGDEVSGEITFTKNLEEGSLTSNIVNQKGSQLPETGGMGTTAMYVVGGVLVAGALLLLITKKRMNMDK